MVSSTMRASLLSIGLLHTFAAAQNTSFITADTHFYGESPPVYPSPPMPGKSTWATAHSKAASLVSQMTPAERANITVGYSTTTGCSGETGSVPRLDFPGLCLSDAGNGLRATDFVNGWASGIHVGASWNKDLTYQRAVHMGAEFKKKGSHVALGPVVGPLGRIAMSGRNWEGFSADPYLCGSLAAVTVQGIQESGVTTSVKHYIGNEQETNRNPSGNVSAVSANIDDKTLHELYLWPFADAVHAGAGSIMCSYNRLNNSYACHNSKTLNGILKTELGFEGFVVSDWGAQHTGLASAEAGLDVAMPNSAFWGAAGGNLTVAVNNGSLAESRLTDMATRIVASWYQMGQDTGFPAPSLPQNYHTPHKTVNARDPASKPILFNGAVEGHVLVKNFNSTLPLKKPQLLSIFGYDAPAPGKVNVGLPTEPLGGPYSFGLEPVFNYSAFISSAGPPLIAANGTLITGGGSGANSKPYISDPFSALQQRAYEDDTSLFWDFYSVSPNVDYSSDACLVFVNAFATEGGDRPALSDDYTDTLVTNVANNCSNTIVTIHNAGIRIVDPWISHPNITAVIFAHLPGQDSGRAIVSLLYGDDNFSGKLPYTVAKKESDYVNAGQPTQPEGQYKYFPQSDFTEGVYIDYRGFEHQNITPRYEFGYGLSYTTFEYSSLTITKTPGNVSTALMPPKSQIIQGGLASLWSTIYSVEAVIANTGEVAGAEVAQLYVVFPGETVKVLRGYAKEYIEVGGQATVKFDLMRRDLSVWDVKVQQWVLTRGTYKILVGASSKDLKLVGSIVL